jgi:ubiquinone/menaquinone biosynthesis C-methylase UbiE
MLKLNEAKNVLEIACGAGKLIPHVLDLKSNDTFYYATDISTEMLHWARVRLENHFQKYESKLTLDEWMKKQNLEFGQVNGEEKIPKEIKFDRIICNLVLMLTTDPAKMLRNLYDSAEDGCLLGLTVWG